MAAGEGDQDSWLGYDPAHEEPDSHGSENPYLFDGQGDVVALEDPGQVVASYDYCPTGNEADLASTTMTAAGLGNPLRQGASPYDDGTKDYVGGDGRITEDYNGTGTQLAVPGSGVYADIGADPGGGSKFTIVRPLLDSETVWDTFDEIKAGTFDNDWEYAVVRLANGDRAIITSSQRFSVRWLPGQVTEVLAHTHPYAFAVTEEEEGPSPGDFAELRALGQTTPSYVLQDGRTWIFGINRHGHAWEREITGEVG